VTCTKPHSKLASRLSEILLCISDPVQAPASKYDSPWVLKASWPLVSARPSWPGPRTELSDFPRQPAGEEHIAFDRASCGGQSQAENLDPTQWAPPALRVHCSQGSLLIWHVLATGHGCILGHVA
jgi:hypothetical protein